ncbi:TetR-like C-terminal domain-containing protein [Streptomyces sanyensis]|uniref:TetR-like C-terminal domain-containing protein n=2 Tax=Streptomyces sanyensis TaxID=568869 RepID=A0ABP8ZLM4_9ACTN
MNVNVVNMASKARPDTGAGAKNPDSYHHGALREALLTGARELLDERGEEGFSLSALARRLGVSTAAPYRHFADRDALLHAVGDLGYEELRRRLLRADAAADGPADTLVGMCAAYLRFAQDNPALFGILFRSRGAHRQSPTGPASFQPLIDAVTEAQRRGVLDSGASPLVLARSIWAAVHGLAVLHLNGGFAKLGLDDTPERLAADTLAAMLRTPEARAPA